ncbi:MAG: betaine-aldehyde dehydrogenase [Salinisphaeraceae bacterium]|nr:betaine-aldehyde dehydrogenase [Salinisphaeraceae bacterium]
MSTQLQHYISGQSINGSGSGVTELVDPVNEDIYATAVEGSVEDVDAAVKAAHAQSKGGEWSKMTGEQRGILINKLADLVERDQELLADMDARAIGRSPIEPRLLDLPNTISTLRHAAGWADKLEGRTIPTPGYMGTPTLSYTQHVPVGVVAAITPWNTPLMILSWKVGPALAAGCTLVIKPATETPFTALHLAKLCTEAGIPDGVVNVVIGRGSVLGNALSEHPLVDKVSFTGSPEVGTQIQQRVAPQCKRVAMELGGKSPQIVFEDADMAAAVQGCAMGVFFNQGQVCAAGTRIFVQRSIADEFSKALAGAADSIKVGDPKEEGVQMGPVAKRGQFDTVNRYIQSGLDEGAQLMAGGVAEKGKGFFVKPTVFGNASNDMTIAREEIFGPVATIIPFDTEADAIRLANDTVYGLAGTVWTNNLARAHRVAQSLEAGAIGVNCWAPIDGRLPWGGFKTSGLGRECGKSGVLGYTEERVVTVLMPGASS